MKTFDEMGISVVMPAYNAEKTIGQAIESVLGQTYAKLELIVVDDKSTDSTQAIVSAYQAKDARVKLLSNHRNSGVAASRNLGVNAAAYPWIAFLDSDDWWLPHKLEKQTEALQAHPECDICFTGTAYVRSCGAKSAYVLHVPEKVTRDDILKQNVISCSSVLARREVLLRYPMPDDRSIHEDLATWMCILEPTSRETIPYALGVDEPLLIYRLSSTGKSGNKIEAAKMQWRTYRVCRVPLFKSIFCFAIYAWRNVRKYRAVLDR